ncbi:hypothetical protein [Lachnoclostridium sp. MSJ-17]|uniref:hypothetical protein n=1 Tax=Lachnoclostridium sp. MSJ-17 TaxID=2841516 RepID=UPI001C0FED2D|nr:hypothetical protein [Lachnoclostridium sp. MSJ-17]MBU5461671.1 hypothetical protein [Lachnoclostridium sp. MSJ-17]
MKVNKLLAIVLTGVLMVGSAISVSAADTYTLTQDNPTGDRDTEVTAEIKAPGEVWYEVAVPTKVDFGILNNVTGDADTQAFDIELIDKSASVDSVYVAVRDTTDADAITDATLSTKFFKLENETTGLVLGYDYLNETGASVLTETTPEDNNYNYYGIVDGLTTIGETYNCTLSLPMSQLSGKLTDEYAGVYTGTIEFYSRATVSAP